MEHYLTGERINAFLDYLRQAERSRSTWEKYRQDLLRFAAGLPEGDRVDKGHVLAWKEELAGKYAASTVNRMLAPLNSCFAYLGWHELRVKPIKRQRRIFANQERELSMGEYHCLLRTAWREKNFRLYYLMETLASTGVRVSELAFITVEALRRGRAQVDCKGKQREVLLTGKLCRVLKEYSRQRGILRGPVFITRTGRPLDRSNIWRELQALCRRAGISAAKVFPHNFRHLFARAFYALEKDIAKLADLLGHASIETTRIYIMESGEEHTKQIERLELVQ